jgi:hypothetical protein
LCLLGLRQDPGTEKFVGPTGYNERVGSGRRGPTFMGNRNDRDH